MSLEELSLADYQSLNKLFQPDIFKVLTVESAVASRKSRGGTAPTALRAQLAELGTLLTSARRTNTKRTSTLAKLWGDSEGKSKRSRGATK